MTTGGSWTSPRGGLAALAAVAAGTAVGIIAERVWSSRRLAEVEVPADPIIAHGTRLFRVTTDDGAIVHARVDTPSAWQPGDPTVVLAHGVALDLSTWEHQRRALLSVARVVSYDHRGHGNSADAYLASPELSIARLGRDMASVIETCAGDEAIIVAGHSMGGMTIMSLAEQFPEWFGERIIGVALLATTAGSMGTITLGLPAPIVSIGHRLAPMVATVATNEVLSNLVMRIRDSGSDVSRVLTRTYAFGETAPEHGTELVAHLLGSTPLPVLAGLLDDIGRHDRRHALAVISRVPTAIIVGDADQLTPVSHSRRLHEAIEGSSLTVLSGVGHMLTLEAPASVDALLVDFTAEVAQNHRVRTINGGTIGGSQRD